MDDDRLDQVVGAGFHLLVDEGHLAALDNGRLLDDLAEAGVRVVVPGARAADHKGAAVVQDVDGT